MSRQSTPAKFFQGLSFTISKLTILTMCLAGPTSSTAQVPLGSNSYTEGSSPHNQQKVSATHTLEPGKVLTNQIGTGETSAYLVTLPAKQFATVEVDQKKLNVTVSVFDSDGKNLAEEDMVRVGDAEVVSLLSDKPETFRVEIRASEQITSPTTYEIKIKEFRAANENDKAGVAAERTVAEGVNFDVQANADSWLQAVAKYEQSIALWKEAGNFGWEASTMNLLATTYINLGEKQKALDMSTQALPIVEEAIKAAQTQETKQNSLRIKANVLETVGRVYNQFGDKRKALEYLNQALPLRDLTGDRVGKVSTLNNLAISYQMIGELQKALDFLDEMGPILHELNDRAKEASRLNNICVIHQSMGSYRKGLEFCNQALSIRRDMNDELGESIVLNNMGTNYSGLGDYQSALDSYNHYYQISKKRGTKDSQAIALNNLGWVYATLGDYEKAIDFYSQSTKIFQDMGDHYREAHVLNNVGVNYADMKDYTKALEVHLKVLAIRGPDNEGRAVSFNNIGYAYQNLGDRSKALEYYNQAIAVHREVGDRRMLASSLKNLGHLYHDMGDDKKALDCYQEGLELTRTIGDRNSEAGIIAQIAGVERDRGNLVAARNLIEEALKVVESLRINLKSYQLRSSFFASIRKYHDVDIDLLMRLNSQHPAEGYDAEAFQASERSRARSLLELLSEANAEIRTGVDSTLLERERTLRQSISAKADSQTRMLNSKHTDQQVADLAQEINNLTIEYEQVQTRIRQTSPRYAALTQPTPLGLKEVQTKFLDPDTLLLEYALGEKRSFVFAVSPDSIRSFELPKRSEIEAAATRLFQLLTARNQRVANETLAQRQTRFQQASADYTRSAAGLSQMLLGPVVSELKQKRLVIVGEGVLQYVPFAALPSPGRGDQPEAGNVPLITQHEIVNLPSASVLAMMRRDSLRRERTDKMVAVFADPVFDQSDPRLRALNNQHVSNMASMVAASEVTRSASESGVQDFERLRFSRLEADQIIRLAPAHSKLEALDFAANRANATSAEVGQYRIIHFATHGLINNQHPELSGVVLSLIDNKGQPVNGFLRLYDIYNLKLQADLVVLSACQTAVGKDIKGEGLVGLTRGFMYAGTPRVVASLWQIEDRASAEFMSRFYEAMLRDGMRPAAALQKAQVSMSQDKRWNSPYYWAAFTLQGEWK